MMSSVHKDVVQAVQRAALNAVDPGQAVHRYLRVERDTLTVADRCYDLNRFQRIWVAGGGKAASPMSAALIETLHDRLSGGVAVTKYGHASMATSEVPSTVRILEAGHPVPDTAGVAGARQLAELATLAGEKDLVICPLSGGASALLTLPVSGIELADVQVLTDQLLRSGATINELNTVRKHLSQIKGGGLARIAAPATVISLVLSDVVGDPLDVIASGPTAPDTTTFADAWATLERYQLTATAPPSILRRLRAGLNGAVADTPKPDDPIFDNVQNVIVGSNRLAAEAAVEAACGVGSQYFVGEHLHRRRGPGSGPRRCSDGQGNAAVWAPGSPAGVRRMGRRDHCDRAWRRIGWAQPRACACFSIGAGGLDRCCLGCFGHRWNGWSHRRCRCCDNG